MIENYLNVLELRPDFNEKQLKKQFLNKARILHPDKNTFKDDTKFKEALEAYNYLKKIQDTNITNDKINDKVNDKMNNSNNKDKKNEKYKDKMNDYEINIKNFLILSNNLCNKILLKLISNLSKENLIKIIEFINKYEKVLNLDKNLKKNIEIILKNQESQEEFKKEESQEEFKKEESQEKIIKIFKPSLLNLLNSDIFIYNFENINYYIPLWHKEIIYKASNNIFLEIKNKPNLPNNITIDENNNLFYKLYISFKELVNNDKIVINIINKKFIIQIEELKIVKYQKYLFYNNGIPKINYDNIYDISQKSIIIIEIFIIDIK